MKTIVVSYRNDAGDIFANCDGYNYDQNSGMFLIVKNGNRIMIPRENVVCIGFAEDVFEEASEDYADAMEGRFN